MKEKLGWLLRHYGMQRLAVIALAWPLYHVAWWIIQLAGYGQTGASYPATVSLMAGTHDIWFGFWVATVSTPLLWMASYRLSVIQVQWAFRAIAFVWLFDGVIAIGQGVWLLSEEAIEIHRIVLQAWAWSSLLPIAIGFLPWGLLEIWELLSDIPLFKRWAYSGIEEHAEWISSRKLKKQTKPFPGRLLS